MAFLKNSWYAAAWADEVVPGQLMARTLLDEPLVFFRTQDGTVQALADRCAHRAAPLHRGKLKGDHVECPYHGLQFDGAGACTHNPHGDGRLPDGQVVRSYPVAERQGVVWAWMGDPAQADTGAIVAFDGLDAERFTINRGYLRVAANHQLLADNLLDSSHIAYVHPSLGSETVTSGRTTFQQLGNLLRLQRAIERERLPGMLAAIYATGDQLVERWIEVQWTPPGLIELTVAVAPTGRPREEALERPTCHLITPETGRSSHYFWSSGRNFRRQDEVLHQNIQTGLQRAFEHEDQPLVEAQQQRLGLLDDGPSHPLVLVSDTALLRARHVMRLLVQQERDAEGAATGPGVIPITVAEPAHPSARN